MARRRFTAAFKAEIALKALRNDATIAELASKHEVHPNVIKKWRSDLVKQASKVFQKKSGPHVKDHTAYFGTQNWPTYD